DPAVIADLVEQLGTSRAKEAAALLEAAGEAAIPALATAAVDPKSYRRRWTAIEVLEKLGATSHVDWVQTYIADLAGSDCGVLNRASRALAELGDPRAIPALRQV